MTAETPPETSLFVRPFHQLAQLLTGSPDLQSHDHEDRNLPVTETLELLVPERRQAILRELAVADQTPIPVSSLAERVACVEYECDIASLTSDQRKRVYIALVQSHLPAFERANVVIYDAEEQLVERGPKFNRVWRTYSAVLESLS